MADSFKPTAEMATNAKRGLDLRDKFDRGGTEIASNAPISSLRATTCPPPT